MADTLRERSEQSKPQRKQRAPAPVYPSQKPTKPMSSGDLIKEKVRSKEGWVYQQIILPAGSILFRGVGVPTGSGMWDLHFEKLPDEKKKLPLNCTQYAARKKGNGNGLFYGDIRTAISYANVRHNKKKRICAVELKKPCKLLDVTDPETQILLRQRFAEIDDGAAQGQIIRALGIPQDQRQRKVDLHSIRQVMGDFIQKKMTKGKDSSPQEWSRIFNSICDILSQCYTLGRQNLPLLKLHILESLRHIPTIETFVEEGNLELMVEKFLKIKIRREETYREPSYEIDELVQTLCSQFPHVDGYIWIKEWHRIQPQRVGNEIYLCDPSECVSVVSKEKMSDIFFSIMDDFIQADNVIQDVFGKTQQKDIHDRLKHLLSLYFSLEFSPSELNNLWRIYSIRNASLITSQKRRTLETLFSAYTQDRTSLPRSSTQSSYVVQQGLRTTTSGGGGGAG
jgi:hypothetical protein